MSIFTKKRVNIFPRNGITWEHGTQLGPRGEDDTPGFLREPATLDGPDRFDPLTMILAGRRGLGKTASLTYIGGILKASYDARNLGVKVAANFNTDIADPDLTSPYIVDEINSFPVWAKDLLLLIDEAGAYFPRRRSLARSQLDFSTFLQQIRKRDIEVVFTTQFPGMLDDQVLINIDLYADVAMWPRKGPGAGSYCYLRIWDWHGQFTGKWGRPRIPPDGPPTWTRRLNRFNTIFPLYNTREVISPIWATGHQRAAISEQYWEFEEDGAVVEGELVKEEPKDLMEYLVSLGPNFTLGRYRAEATTFEPDIRTVEDFEARIQALGLWTIIQNGNRNRMAVRKP